MEEKTKSSSNGSMFMKKDMPKSMKMKLKGGGFVDPDSNLEHKVYLEYVGVVSSQLTVAFYSCVRNS